MLVEQDETRASRRAGVAALLTIAVASTLVAYAAHPLFPANPVRLPLEERIRASAWAPQGWKFFTRDPQEERTFGFLKTEGGWRAAPILPWGDRANAFGLVRASRHEGEIAQLAGRVPASRFGPCNDAPIRCIEASEALPLKNLAPAPKVCGTVGIALQKPVPWAWAAAGSAVTMPSRIVKLEVRC